MPMTREQQKAMFAKLNINPRLGAHGKHETRKQQLMRLNKIMADVRSERDRFEEIDARRQKELHALKHATKQFFIKKARELYERRAGDREIADVSDALEKTNPQFDKLRFYDAAKTGEVRARERAKKIHKFGVDA